jgi:hypothetical protein
MPDEKSALKVAFLPGIDVNEKMKPPGADLAEITGSVASIHVATDFKRPDEELTADLDEFGGPELVCALEVGGRDKLANAMLTSESVDWSCGSEEGQCASRVEAGRRMVALELKRQERRGRSCRCLCLSERQSCSTHYTFQ